MQEKDIRKRKILLLEDDIMIASGLLYALEMEGYEPIHCKSISEAEETIGRVSFDLAILDMQLPDGDGFEIGEKLQPLHTAIIYLTVVDDENRIVQAFEKGAADYVTKPFRVRELLARIKRALCMQENVEQEAKVYLKIGDVRIDQSAGKVYIGTEIVDLTALEYRLLLIFANNQNQILSRSQILESIWDSSGNFVEDNTLTVYVKRLRQKLGEAIEIETVRGMGYRVH